MIKTDKILSRNIRPVYRRYKGAIPALYRRCTGAIPALYRRYSAVGIREYDPIFKGNFSLKLNRIYKLGQNGPNLVKAEAEFEKMAEFGRDRVLGRFL